MGSSHARFADGSEELIQVCADRAAGVDVQPAYRWLLVGEQRDGQG